MHSVGVVMQHSSVIGDIKYEGHELDNTPYGNDTSGHLDRPHLQLQEAAM